ncbi:MAG: diacylglycerol/polyprenol kinase family protein [Desulfosalsimonas sp.]
MDVKEIRRKLLHLAALGIPFGILYLPQPAPLFAALALAAVAAEILRKKIPPLQRLFLLIFGGVLRPEEEEKITGGTFFFISGAVCAALFDPAVAYTAMAFVIVGDAAAAIAGMKFGSLRFSSGKSLEGALASVAACLIFWMLFPATGFARALAAALLTGTLELLAVRINDNLFVPLICGLVLQTWAGW